MSRIDPGWGLVVLEPRHTLDTLAPVGVATRSSSYTEDGPLPGLAVPADTASSWRPQVAGAQSVALTLATIRGGYAGRDGAEVLYRLATDSSNDAYRSWSDPNLLTGYSSGSGAGATGTRGTAVAWTGYASCATPDGYLVVVAVNDTAGTGQAWRYNVRTGRWTDGHTFAANAPGLEGPIGLVYDPDHDRVILYSGTNVAAGLRQAAFYSTDAGITFQGFSRRTLGGGTVSGADLGAIRIAARPGGLDWLAVVINETDGTGDGSQWASSNCGVSFDLIGSFGGTAVAFWPIWTGSTFLIAYVDTADQLPRVKLLGSARAPFDDAAAVLVDSTRTAQVVVPVADADGILYLYATRNTGGSVYPDLAVYRSIDGGLTWDRYLGDAWTTEITGGVSIEWQGAAAIGGCVFLTGQALGTADTDNTLAIARFGGWGQVAHGGGSQGTVLDHDRRAGFADSAALTSLEGRCYLPIGSGSALGFNVSSAGATLSLAGEGYSLTEAAGGGAPAEWRYTCTGSAKSSVMFEAEVRNTAGDTRATVIATGPGPHATLRLSDGATFEYDVIVHFASDGIALEDGNSGAQIDSIALTMNGTEASGSATWTRVRVYLVAGRVDWWYQQTGGDLDTVWIKGTGGTVSNGAAFPTQSQIIWGLATTVTAATTVVYRFLGVCFGGEWMYGTEALAEWEKGYTAGYRGHVYGHPVSGRAAPYPVPDLTSSTEAIGGLTASGGPTYLGEIVQLPVAYGWPVDAVHPGSSPSPRDGWRATGTTELLLVYDLTDPAWYGDALALFVSRARPYAWVLETDDGGAGWTTLGTLDLTVGSSLTYTRSGTVITPNGGTSVARYFAENELVGGYVEDSTGYAANIAANSAGWWGGSSRQQLRLEVSNRTASFPSSGSTLRIVAAHGLLVVYPTSAVVRRYVRIRAAASAIVPASKYTAGIAALGRVIGVGADPSFAWSRELATRTRRAVAGDGTSRARELGPPRRRLTYGWPEYSDTRKLREAADYVGISGGLAFGTGEDSAHVPQLLDVVESGEVPVVVVPRLPTSSGSTLIGRDEIVYGRITTDSIETTGMYGVEGTDEVVRVGSITVEELR